MIISTGRFHYDDDDPSNPVPVGKGETSLIVKLFCWEIDATVQYHATIIIIIPSSLSSFHPHHDHYHYHHHCHHPHYDCISIINAIIIIINTIIIIIIIILLSSSSSSQPSSPSSSSVYQSFLRRRCVES